jgi:nicotinamidase-related amidase
MRAQRVRAHGADDNAVETDPDEGVARNLFGAKRVFDAPVAKPYVVTRGNAAVNEELTAELVAAVLSGRPERLLDVALAQEPPELRAAFYDVAKTVAALGLTAEPAAPSAGLRSRILATVGARMAARTATARKAVVVLDMIKEHLTPGLPLEVPRARLIVPALQARLEAARASGVPIVYLVDEHDPDDTDMDGVEGWGAHAIRGSEGTEVWPELAPRDGDHVVKKSTYSAFTGSRFEAVLGGLGVDTIVLTGCLTEIGILATATDALQRGFAVEVPSDAQAGSGELAEKVALGVLSIMPPYGPARRARLATQGVSTVPSL